MLEVEAKPNPVVRSLLPAVVAGGGGGTESSCSIRSVDAQELPVLLLLYIPCRLLSTDLSRPPKQELTDQSRCELPKLPDIPVSWMRWECMDTKTRTRPRRTPRTQDRPKEARRPQGPQAHQKRQNKPKTPRKAPKSTRTPPEWRHWGSASAAREREGEPKQRANQIMFA